MSISLLRSIRLWFVAALIAMVLWLILGINVRALHQVVSFDGAMNLQVSASLANGDGYRRTYAERQPFPDEIETNYPFTLPAAAVFKLFGVKLWTAQVTSLAYLLALFTAIHWMIARGLARSWDPTSCWPWLAVLFCLAIPELSRFGLNGYGEVPALFWFIVACVVLFLPAKEGDAHCRRRIFLGGLFIGLSICTKTVLLIGAGAVGLTMLVSGLSIRPRAFRQISGDIGVFLLGVAVVVVPFEAWRLWSVGGWPAYQHWWTGKYGQIAMQSGVKAGFADTSSLPAKIGKHFLILSKSLRLSPEATGLLLVIEAAIIIAAMFASGRQRVRWVIMALALAAAAYLGWWLAITPTQKAWLRRIVNGLLILQVATGFALGVLWAAAAAGPRRQRVGLVLVATVVCGIHAPQLLLGLRSLPETKMPATASETIEVADWLKKLAPDALVFGEAWYSAPALSLYAARPLLDLNDWPLTRLSNHRVIYLAVDHNSMSAHAFSEVMSLYEAKNLFPKNKTATIYELDPKQKPRAIVHRGSTPILGFVDFAKGSYEHSVGFSPENQPWRWMRSDATALLRYDGAATDFVLSLEIARHQSYLFTDEVSVSVSINGHEFSVIRDLAEGPAEIRFPVAGLGLARNEIVHLHIRCNNALRTPIDLRQLSVRVRAFGFTHAHSNSTPAH